MEKTIQELFDLTGRVAMVTGGCGYLGSAMARVLAEAGAMIVVSSRDGARARKVADGLPKAGGVRHAGVALDQLDEASVEKGFAEAVKAAGQVDILVNNAHAILGADWTDVTAEEFNGQLANMTGYFLLARLVRNHAVERTAPASIIMLGSMYGVVGSYPEVYDGFPAAISLAQRK